MKNIVSRQCSSWRKAWSTSSLTTLPSCRASWLGSRSKTYVLIHNLANHTSETAIIEAVFLSHVCDEGRERTKRCRAQSFQYSCMFCMSRFWHPVSKFAQFQETSWIAKLMFFEASCNLWLSWQSGWGHPLRSQTPFVTPTYHTNIPKFWLGNFGTA